MDQHHRIISPRHPISGTELRRYLTRREMKATIDYQAALEPTYGGWSYDFKLLQWVYRSSEWE